MANHGIQQCPSGHFFFQRPLHDWMWSEEFISANSSPIPHPIISSWLFSCLFVLNRRSHTDLTSFSKPFYSFKTYFLLNVLILIYYLKLTSKLQSVKSVPMLFSNFSLSYQFFWYLSDYTFNAYHHRFPFILSLIILTVSPFCSYYSLVFKLYLYVINIKCTYLIIVQLL